MTRCVANCIKYMMIVSIACVFLAACGNNKKSPDSGDTTVLEKGQTSFESAVLDSNDNLDGASNTAETALDANEESSVSTDAERVIEESDIIKADGNLLYILNSYQGLYICDAQDPDHPVIAGHVFLPGTPFEMYVKNGMAYVLASKPNGCIPVGQSLVPQDNTERQSMVYAVSVSDPTQPVVMDTMDFKGWFSDSRIVGSILYTVTNYYGYSTEKGYVGQTLVCSVDLTNDGALTLVDSLDLADEVQYIHVTDQAMFAMSDMGYYASGESTLNYIDISDAGGKMKERGSIDVKGQVRDKFKLDYYDGFLRVCTYLDSTRTSMLNTVDVSDPDNMIIRGSLLIDKGETLFATRFDGGRAYVVTFLQVDPLWVIDLSDQAHPVVASKLEVPGWSTHIESRGNVLVALGVDNSDGWNVSVSLFNVENPESPLLADRLSFGAENGWSWSTAYSDYRAFTLLDELGLILLPYQSYESSTNTYVNRLQLIDFDNENLDARGSITQKGNIVRSGTISDRLFAVSNDELCVINAHDRDNPIVTSVLPLAENVRKFIPLDNGYGVMVLDNGDGSTAMRSVPLDDISQPGSETIRLGAYCSDVIRDGNTVVALMSEPYVYDAAGTESSEAVLSEELLPSPWESGSQLTVIDFSDPVLPVKKGSLRISGMYYTEYDSHEANRVAVGYGNKVHNMGNHILLFESRQDYYYGYAETDSSPAHKAVAVDLADADNPQIVSTYGFDDTIYHLFTNGSMVYFTYCTPLNNNRTARYYLGRVDMSDPANPVKVKPVNIPGICLGVDTKGVIAYTWDQQYLNDDSLQTYFCTLSLSDEQAMLLDSVALNKISGLFLRDGSRFYFQQELYYWACADCELIFADAFMPTYGNSESIVYAVDASSPEDIGVFKHDLNEDGCYKTLHRAFGDKLLASSANALILYDASKPDDFVMTDLEPVNAWFNSATHTETAVYVSEGYNGLIPFRLK